MLLGGNLGFSSWLVVVVVFLFVPVVIGFVVRRKWRFAVARREEIKRLLVLASEEAARAELEASNGYFTVIAAEAAIPKQLPYQCAVCFSPTTTRCARCKAVRYCSGKCQIVHWRQGHKEECRPFIIINQNNDVGGEFVQKENNRKVYETYGNNYEPEERQCADPEPFPNSSSSRHVLGRKSDIESPADTFTSSAKLNHIKTDCSDGDTHCESTSSSGWTVDGSNESSLSEPSTPSSGFWEGTIDSSRSKNDGLDDVQSGSNEGGNDSVSGFQSSVHFSCNFAKDAVPPLPEQGPDAKIVISDGAHPTNVGIKKPNAGAILSEEIRRDASKERNSPSSSSKMSYHTHSESGGESHVLKNGDNTSFSGSVFSAHPAFSTERRSRRTYASHNEPISSEVQKVHLSSRPPDTHLSASTVLHSVSSAKSGKVDGALKTSVMKVVDRLRPSELSRHYPLGVESGVTGRYNNKGLFSYELFVKLYNSKKTELRPCGLTNCGNSCYANAVLQCLAFTPPLTAYLLEGLHSKTCKKMEWCFTCEFERLVLKAEEGSSPLSPIGILSQLQNIGSHLGGGREEDAHEFLRYAIDTMQSVCLNETGVTASSSMEEETTLIGLTFGGYLRSKIKCTQCGGKSERHEKIMDLTVEIDGDIETLEEALKKFTSTEILDGQNKYHCGRCKSYEKAKKRLTVLEAPNVLTIALKRFQSGKFGKLNKTVRFPEILDLAPCMSGTSDKSPIYRLYGVVVHLDVMNASFSGHYVCYIKNIQNKWFKTDDSMVKPVEIESVLTKGAYMLLYARCSPRAPQLIRNPMIPRDSRKSKNQSFKSRPHTPVPRDVSMPGQTNSKPIYTNHPSPRQTHFEEDFSSDNSSSPCFSEESSSSTDSTRGSSTSADEFLDQIFGDLGQNWHNRWRNSSDSDTSSSSSSPSPSYSGSDWYSSRYPKTSGSHIDNPESAMKGHGLRARLTSRSGISEMVNLESKGSVPFSCSDTTEQCRKLGHSSSCREINSNRLGRVNPFDFKSGVSFSRSMRDRTT